MSHGVHRRLIRASCTKREQGGGARDYFSLIAFRAEPRMRSCRRSICTSVWGFDARDVLYRKRFRTVCLHAAAQCGEKLRAATRRQIQSGVGVDGDDNEPMCGQPATQHRDGRLRRHEPGAERDYRVLTRRVRRVNRSTSEAIAVDRLRENGDCVRIRLVKERCVVIKKYNADFLF